jgi:hypothetical protein
MVTMGLGLIAVDPKLGAVAGVYTDPFHLPVERLLLFVGVTKVQSVMKLWNVGPMPSDTLAFIGLAAPALAASIGHAKIEGLLGAVPPLIYFCLLSLLVYLDRNDAAKIKASWAKSPLDISLAFSSEIIGRNIETTSAARTVARIERDSKDLARIERDGKDLAHIEKESKVLVFLET